MGIENLRHTWATFQAAAVLLSLSAQMAFIAGWKPDPRGN
jgi:hypothetical protein